MSLSVVMYNKYDEKYYSDRNLWNSNESCSFMYCDLDLGVDIMDQRQDRHKIFLCVMRILVKRLKLCAAHEF